MVEVLAVIVILVIIVSIAIPNITASLDRQGCKTTKSRAQLIESAAQFYVSDNRNNIKKGLGTNTSCKITLDNLKPNYITSEDLKDGNNGSINGYVIYNQGEETYTFCFEPANSCVTNASVCSISNECVTS